MTERYKQLPIKIDLSRLQIETAILLSNKTKLTQVSIQTNGDDDWTSGNGSRPGQAEEQWNVIHPQLVGSWWESFINALPMPVYRARIMKMLPRTCYSIHKDIGPRLHIAISTNPQAKFLFTDPAELIHIPADGNVWWVDTRHEHSAFNGSMQSRLHLIMCLANTDDD
jgi:hypothetical protein